MEDKFPQAVMPSKAKVIGLDHVSVKYVAIRQPTSINNDNAVKGDITGEFSE